MEPNLCKGCKVFRDNIPVRCTILQDGVAEKCPCNFCIVQVMCQNICKLRNEFRLYLYVDRELNGYE
jgi:hypothetical protein